MFKIQLLWILSLKNSLKTTIIKCELSLKKNPYFRLIRVIGLDYGLVVFYQLKNHFSFYKMNVC